MLSLNCRKRNKGFTLVELVVSLGVGAIIVSMLSISLVSVNKIFKDKNYALDMINDYNLIKENIVNFSNICIQNSYTLKLENKDNELIFINGQNNERVIKFENNYLQIDNKNEIKFNAVKNIEFENQNSIITCYVYFYKSNTLKFIV